MRHYREFYPAFGPAINLRLTESVTLKRSSERAIANTREIREWNASSAPPEMNITNSIKTGVGTRERRKNEGLLPRHECRRMNRAGRKVKKIRRELFQREMLSWSFFALFTLNQNQKSDAKLLVLCTKRLFAPLIYNFSY